MKEFSVSTTVSANADALYRTIINFEDFPNYINGVREVRRLKPTTDGLDEVDALVTVRYFTGRAAAKVRSEPTSRTIDVEFVKGPFQIAKAKIAIQETSDPEQCDMHYVVQYATPIAIYTSLIERHRQKALERISALFAKRSQPA